MKSVTQDEKHFNWLKTLTVIIGVLILLNATPVPGAELLPFPSGPQQQQQQTGVDPRVYVEFRAGIERLDCPSLSQVREDLVNKRGSSMTSADQDYYTSLISILDSVKTAKPCP